MNVFGLELPDVVIDIAVLVLILAGAVLCLSAAVGLLHFRDVPTRLHAATKPQVLGLVLICTAIALSQRSIGGILVGVLLVVPVVLVAMYAALLPASLYALAALALGSAIIRGVQIKRGYMV